MQITLDVIENNDWTSLAGDPEATAVIMRFQQAAQRRDRVAQAVPQGLGRDQAAAQRATPRSRG